MAHYIRLLVVLLAIILVEKSIAQNKTKVDSLKILLSTPQDDSTKISLLLKLARYDDPLERLDYAKAALNLAKKNNFKNKEGLSLEYMSLAHRKLGNYPEAIKASLEALRIYDELGLDNKTAAIQLQIGSHFTNDKNFLAGSHYMNQALATFKKRKDSVNIAYTLINLGETYRLMEKYDSSSICFLECLSLNKKLNRNNIQGYALGNLGLVHAQMDQIDSAKKELPEAIKILAKLGDTYSVSVYQSQLGKILIDEGNQKEGEKLILASLNMAENESLKEQIRDISKDLSLFYEDDRQFEKALFYRKKFETYNDSLVNIDNVRKVEQIHNQYWLDKKEIDIQLLETKNENKQKLLIILSVSAMLLLTLSVFLYRIQRQRKKAFNKVSEQNVIIEKREQEKALLLRELNHRVKNNLQMVASLFNLQASQFKGHEVADALKAARNRVDTLILIHQKLYRPDIDAQVSLNDYIKELADYLVFSSGKKVDLSLDLIPFKLSIDSAIPLGLIINELITNSLKYSGEDQQNPALNISLSENGELIFLALTDNGIGLPEDFDIKERQSLGIKLVYSLIKQLNGEISHSNNNGCQWLISLNKNKL